MMLVVGIAVVAALPATGSRLPWPSKRIALLALLLVLAGGGMLFFGARPFLGGPHLAEAKPVPDRRVEGGYVSSQACQSCHADQFHSWHDSYHRTMTQAVTPETVLAPFDNTEIETQGLKFRFYRRGDEFWVNMPDVEWILTRQAEETKSKVKLTDAPQVDRRIVMSTGSHHMQLYWTVSPLTNRYYNVPIIYLIHDQRWAPRANVFLVGGKYYEDHLPVQSWNDVCVNCHAVAGQPRVDEKSGHADTRVAELGIACEACHGPGEEHVRVHTVAQRQAEAGQLASADQAASTPQRGTGSGDPTIINPARCDSKTSAQICGRCHGISHPQDELDWKHGQGDTFRPGTNLFENRLVVRDPRQIALEAGADPNAVRPTNKYQLPAILSHYYWPDGQVRVSGRDFNGLLESPCYQRGDMACVSCHSLHEGKPENQLGAGMDGNQACLQCHGEYESKLTEHTHHAADSEGSRCYNCHMPHTTYGLMKGIRSHTVTNPSVEESTKYGRPNACNLCHLDETLQWTGEHLTSWYGQPAPTLLEEEKQTSAALRWLLRGDAGQRALAAWHFGWEPARQASGTDWMPPFLAELLVDPYSAVRYMSYHALKKNEGFQEIDYDFVAPLKERAAVREQMIERWKNAPHEIPPPAAARLLMNPDGTLQEEAVRKTIGARDDRKLELWE
ncbi:MAG: hypothetical protein KF708_05825 [Pirellulales bacterium]|nr:hypothetical protein [Pirellulales bacterium]